jgi:hypothetical protein
MCCPHLRFLRHLRPSPLITRRTGFGKIDKLIHEI